jgi:glycosyltransferase involved in cell wall biosynthesis
MTALVTVITATWRRHGELTGGCIPSVREQEHPAVEHLVISDGPDPELREILAAPGPGNLRYHELPAHDEHPHWGGPARRAGLELAAGDYIAYCDDDDRLRPRHCALLAAALDAHPEAGFAVSRMLSRQPLGDLVIGAGELAAGDVGTPMIMHRRDILDIATWGEPSAFEDWNLVWAWLSAGVPHVRVGEVTADAWPSVFR